MRVLSGRVRQSLDGRWRFARDRGDVGVAEGWPSHGLPEPSDTLAVPGVWNRAYPLYEGVAWYDTTFSAADAPSGPAWLRVEAANQLAELWLNGMYLGAHEGGYTPFVLRCEQALRTDGPNRLVARIVDPPMEGEAGGLRLWETACAKESWYYRYGGIWGSVALVRGGAAWLEDAFLRASPDLRVARARVEVGSDNPASARLRLDLLDPEGRVAGAAEQAIELTAGISAVEMGLPVGPPLPWEPERPARYVARLTLSASDHQETVEVEFGLRHSELRDGRFFLNGRERYLKGALVQPNYPLELVRPHDEEMLDREIEALRRGAFNLARVHLRPPAPGFLERADRAGLLVYVETALAWIHPHERLLERGQREVRETVRLLRNHPSVAIWGCFNENRRSAAQVGKELLDLGHALDPTRPIIDDSGGSAVDEGGGWFGQTWCWSSGDPRPVPLNDLHVYFGSPMRTRAEEYLLRLGGEARFPLSAEGRRRVGGKRSHELGPGAVFVSEFGYGGIPDMERVADGFGEEVEGVDAQDAIGWRDSLRQGVASRGLDAVFGGVSGLVAGAQALHARGDVRQTEALRLNPHVSGYVVTQLNDAAWELSAGLVDLWRQPKPALDAMARVNQPRVLVLRTFPEVAVAGRTVQPHAWLVDEQPASAPGLLRLNLVDGDGQAADVLAREVAVGKRITRFRLPVVVAETIPGQYRLRASLDLAGQLVETEQPLLVLPDIATATGQGLQVLGDRLGRRLSAAEPWTGGAAPLVAQAGSLRGAVLKQAVEWVRVGGHLVLLDLDRYQTPRLARAFGLELSAHGTRGSFLGYFHFLRPHPLFAGLPTGVAHEPFADVLPAWSLGELPGADIPAAVVTVGANRAWAWFADVQTLSYGSGRLTFYHYQPHRAAPYDAVANLLLRNLSDWLLS